MLRQYVAPLGTLIALLLYLSVFLSVKLTDSLPKPASESKQNSLNVNLTQAWEDLHRIATGPHPYNSRRNDAVAEYLLERLQGVAEQYPDVEVNQDLVSNGTFRTTYFEGTNILVKIPGTARDADKDSILFSAHYDSVSTSTGTVDDGIAIVCMLQLAQKFAKDRGKKTAIFNFNNGEEDWLNGAKAFMQHPWSNLTSTFLNLEGAASGGRPLLFRSTSLGPVKSFSRSVPHPHTSILAADAFAAGVIRSGTDYSVYANPSTEGSYNPHGMQGLDLAFYKGRSRYHTKYDAIAWLEGGTYRAVWGMLESAVAVGNELLTGNTGGKAESAVYFDVFGHATVVFSLNSLRIYNIVFLSVTPIVVILLSICKRLAAPGGLDSYKLHFRWVRFWFALILTGATQVGLVALYKNFNPYVVYSYPYLTLFTSFALTYITLYIALSVPFRLPYFITSRISSSTPTINPNEVKFRSTQATTVLLQLLILSYILLFVPIAILSGGQNIGSIYPLTALLTCAFAGWVVGVGGEMLFGIYGDDGVEVKRERVDGTDDEEEAEEAHDQDQENGHQERRYVSGVMYTAPHDRENSTNTESTVRPTSPNWSVQSPSNNGPDASGEQETEPTEITPLIQQRREAGLPLTDLRLREEGVGKELARMIVWLLQVALVVPIPVILVAHIALIMVDGSSQSVVDGGGVGTIYASFSVISLLLLLPVMPFLPAPSSLPPPPTKSKKGSKFPDTTTSNGTMTLTFIVFILFLVSALLTSGILGLLSRAIGVSEAYRPGFPFGVESPMKVYFQQQVEIRPSGKIVPSTTLTGVPYYMEKLVVPELPSSHGEKGKGVNCGEATGRGKGGEGLRKCAWENELPPWPGAYKADFTDSIDGEDGWEKWWNLDWEGAAASSRVPKNPYFRAQVSTPIDGRKNLTRTIAVEGRNTRNCRIYFNSPTKESPSLAKVKEWRVRGGDGVGKEVPGGEGEGVKEVRMWSRTWGREFVLDAELDASSEGHKLSGRVACEWTEYRSGLVEPRSASAALPQDHTADVSGDEKGENPSIPAYEEVLQNLPRWAVATKLQDGLVEVWWKFEI